MTEIYAHSLKGHPKTDWQTLEEHSGNVNMDNCSGERVFLARPNQSLDVHLTNVASVASDFAASFGGSNFAKYCGYLHDLGKYSNSFQNYLRESIAGNAKRGEVVHSHFGGMFAKERVFDIYIVDIVVNILCSHHGRLLDMLDSGERTSEKRLNPSTVRNGMLAEQSYKEILSNPYAKYILKIVETIDLKYECFDIIRKFCNIGTAGSFYLHLFVKMVFSCLVDADRCDAAGVGGIVPVPDWDSISASIETYLSTIDQRSRIGIVRKDISRQCLESACRGQGIYTLSVPTGGGKTLSSLRFAVNHAKKHKLKRVIYVIPYLSIIDQTASVFRSALGDNAADILLEHHSNVAIDSEEEESERKLLTERWDKPIIVTTMVRFLETIMSNRASDLRRLHNISDSVLVFDEIQSLPVRCTYIFNETLNFLTKACRASAVVCTATQSSQQLSAHTISLSVNHSLVKLSPSDMALFERVRFKDMSSSPMTPGEVARLAYGYAGKGMSVLVVMNTRKTALSVYNACRQLSDFDVLFLSTDLCPQHRKDNIKKLKENCSSIRKVPTICVSTQLVEAGVDLSFDVVIRANAGIDNIIQAAGRCNRNREHLEKRPVYVVEVEGEDLTKLPEIIAAKDAKRRAMLDLPGVDFASQEMIDKYYFYFFGHQEKQLGYPINGGRETIFEILGDNESARCFYKDVTEMDYQGCAASFETAAENFHVIDNSQISAVVQYQPDATIVLDLVSSFKSSYDPNERIKILRKLQPYTVSVFANKENWLQERAEKIDDSFYLVGYGYYNRDVGIAANDFESVL